jgi:hypothetical protein
MKSESTISLSIPSGIVKSKQDVTKMDIEELRNVLTIDLLSEIPRLKNPSEKIVKTLDAFVDIYTGQF